MRTRPKRSALQMALVVAAAVGLGGVAAQAQQPPIKSTVLENVELGNLPAGARTLRMSLREMQPGSTIPPHTHAGPGVRYVLSGAISVNWKDRGMQTFKAGTTYYEGAGSNHPPSEMSARNAASSVTRVLIVELVPDE